MTKGVRDNQKRDALLLLDEEIKKERKQSYEELKRLVVEEKSLNKEVKSYNQVYEIEILYFWDNQPNGDIRVAGNVCVQASFSTFRPWSLDFIMSPDGTFKGE